MIANIAISASKIELDSALKQYIERKIGRLDRFLPRHARKSVHAEVRLIDVNRPGGNKYECEVIIHVPAATITAKDTTLNTFAAVDIVEEKLKNQLRKYKDAHEQASQGGRHGILRRFKSRLAGSEVV